MKNCIMILTFILACTSYSQAEWRLQESGVNNNLKSIYFVNDTIGFVAGKQIILKTTDGGKKWLDVMRDDLYSLRASYGGAELMSLSFPTDSIGYASGVYPMNPTISFREILKTTNQGETWNELDVGGWGEISLIAFRTPNEGLIVVNDTLPHNPAGLDSLLANYGMYKPYFLNGTTLRTTDAGESWQNCSMNPQSVIFDLVQVNEDTCFAIGYTEDNYCILYQSTDAGKKWRWMRRSPNDLLAKLCFINTRQGFAAGVDINDRSTFIMSIQMDTSNGWSFSKVPINRVVVLDLKFQNATRGYAVGAQGSILETSDGGKTWMQQGTPTNATMNSIFISNKGIAYAVGERGTILTNGVNTSNVTRNMSIDDYETIIGQKLLNGEFRGALILSNEAIGQYPKEKMFYERRATAKQELGDIIGARSDLDTALSIDSSYAAAYANRGQLKEQAQDLVGAKEDYDKALKSPNMIDVLLLRANVELKLGQYDPAIRDVDEYLRIADKSTKDLNEFLADSSSRVFVLSGSDYKAGVYELRARAKMEKGDSAGAKTDFTKALEQQPEDCRKFFYQGMIKILESNNEGGCSLLKLSSDKGCNVATNALKRFCR